MFIIIPIPYLLFFRQSVGLWFSLSAPALYFNTKNNPSKIRKKLQKCLSSKSLFSFCWFLRWRQTQMRRPLFWRILRIWGTSCLKSLLAFSLQFSRGGKFRIFFIFLWKCRHACFRARTSCKACLAMSSDGVTSLFGEEFLKTKGWLDSGVPETFFKISFSLIGAHFLHPLFFVIFRGIFFNKLTWRLSWTLGKGEWGIEFVDSRWVVGIWWHFGNSWNILLLWFCLWNIIYWSEVGQCVKGVHLESERQKERERGRVSYEWVHLGEFEYVCMYLQARAIPPTYTNILMHTYTPTQS